MNMDTTHKTQSRNGVALIIVLGLLSILTILGVAFAIAMRVERMAAHHYANSVRAQQMVNVALARAMEDVNDSMLYNAQRQPKPVAYPTWTNREPFGVLDAMASYDSGAQAKDRVKHALRGEAEELIPDSLLADAEAVTNYCYWTNIEYEGLTNGRIAYLVVNSSGLLDANYVGGQQRVWSTNVHELDISGLPDISNVNAFTNERVLDRCYQNVAELAALNTGVDNVENLFTFSLDLNKDQIFLTQRRSDWWNAVDTRNPPPMLGRRDVILTNKFHINSITNYDGYNTPGDFESYARDTKFMNDFYTPLLQMLDESGLERPPDVVWNLINYLDPDRIPQGGHSDRMPWIHTEGGEPIPLINEITLSETNLPGVVTNKWVPQENPRLPGYPGSYQLVEEPGGPAYRFAVEVWYPFAPISIGTNDMLNGEPAFWLQVGVYSSSSAGAWQTAMKHPYCNTNFSFTAPIEEMRFGSDTEFLVFRSPTNKLVRFVDTANPTNPPAHIGGANKVWMLARVVHRDQAQDGSVVTNIVDEAMGYKPGDDRRVLREFASVGGYEVNDPRSNGQLKYWIPTLGRYYTDPQQNTLGATNVATGAKPWVRKCHGLPIYMKNSPMLNIGEIGHVFRSNLDDEEPNPLDHWWRNIDLMHRDEGAALMDWLTIRDPDNTNDVQSAGLVAINSRQRDVIKALLYNLEIGFTNVITCEKYPLEEGNVDNLVDEIIASGPYTSFKSMFTSKTEPWEEHGGPVAIAFRDCAPETGHGVQDIMREDTFRHMVELVTFRQNVFTIFLYGQALAPKGGYPVGEARAVATVYRDAYTGRHFLRSFKWLND